MDINIDNLQSKLYRLTKRFDYNSLIDYQLFIILLYPIILNINTIDSTIITDVNTFIEQLLEKITEANKLELNDKYYIDYSKKNYDINNISLYSNLFVMLQTYFSNNQESNKIFDIIKNNLIYIYNQLNLQYNLDDIEEIASKKYAWFTFVSKPLYLEGAKNLYLRMKYLKSKYPVIILITGNEITQEDLKILGDIPYITAPLVQFNPKGVINQEYRYNDTLMKFYAFELTDYERIGFLDADLIPLINIDDWFDLYNLGHDYDGFKTIRYNDNTSTFNVYAEGCIGFFTPKKGKFQEIINLVQINNFYCDEDITSFLYLPHLLDTISSKLYSYPLFHTGGPFKYWTSMFYTPQIVNYPYKKIQNFINNFNHERPIN